MQNPTNTSIQLTTNNVSDSQVLGDLLNQIPQDEQIDSVYTDGAYDTKQCRQVIADRQAHAVIPPRKNAKPWKDTKSSSLERNELRTIKRLGTLWKKWSGYHRRSLVETKMHCIKLLGDKLSARSFDSQVKIHARVAVQQIYGIRSTTYPSYALNLAQLGALCISNLCATKPNVSHPHRQRY